MALVNKDFKFVHGDTFSQYFSINKYNSSNNSSNYIYSIGFIAYEIFLYCVRE